MELIVGRRYQDRDGHVWTITDKRTNQSGTQVSGGRWEGKSRRGRIWRWDGRFWPDGRDDRWDLITEVTE